MLHCFSEERERERERYGAQLGAARDIHSVRRIEKAKQRSRANQMAYYDTDTLATDDAIRVGQLHCLRPG